MSMSYEDIRLYRTRELTIIQNVLAAGNSFLITGEKGSGKSILSGLAREILRNEGFKVVSIRQNTEARIFKEISAQLKVARKNPDNQKALNKEQLRIAVEDKLAKTNTDDPKPIIFIVDDADTHDTWFRKWLAIQVNRNVKLLLFATDPPRTDIFVGIGHLKLSPFIEPGESKRKINLSLRSRLIMCQCAVVLTFVTVVRIAQNKPIVKNYSQDNLTTTPVYPEEKYPEEKYPEEKTIEPEYKPEPHGKNTIEPESKPESHQNNTVPYNPIVSIRVNDPSHIQIKKLSLIKKGDVIADDSEKRNNLTNELKSIESQIKNLTNEQVTKPFPPAKALSWRVMESQKLVVEMEEKSFYQAQLKLKLARSMHDSHISQLDNEKAGLKKEVEKLQTEFQLYEDIILGRKDFIKSQKDDYIDPPILPDEKASLQVSIDKHEQVKSVLQEQQAKLNNFANEHQQKLLRLLLEVENAEKALALAKSRQIEAQQKYEQLKQQTSQDEEIRLEQQKQNQKIYDNDLRNRKYQLEKLNLRMSEINEELNQIPVFRSPRDGHVTEMIIEYEPSGKYLIKVTIQPFLWELSE